MTLRFTVPGRPMGEPRKRATTVNGKARLYTPSKARDYRATVQDYAREAMRVAGLPGAFTGAVRLEVTAWRDCPRSTWRKRAPRGARPDTSKPDWDNIGKLVGDALNGVVYIDDAQVADGRVRTFVAAQGEPPCVEVVVEALDCRAAAIEHARELVHLLAAEGVDKEAFELAARLHDRLAKGGEQG